MPIIVVRSGENVHDGVHDKFVIFGQKSLNVENLGFNTWIVYGILGALKLAPMSPR